MTEQEAINFLRSKGYKVDKVTQPAQNNTTVSNQTEQQYGNNMTADGIVKGMNTANTMLTATKPKVDIHDLLFKSPQDAGAYVQSKTGQSNSKFTGNIYHKSDANLGKATTTGEHVRLDGAGRYYLSNGVQQLPLYDISGHNVSEVKKDTNTNTNTNTNTDTNSAQGAQGTKDNPWPNSIKAQAEAKAGDYITTSKGLIPLTQGDINWAKQKVSGTPVAKQVVDNEASLRAKVKEARDAYNKAEKSGSKVPYEEKQRLYNIYLDAWKAWKAARG